MNTGGRGNAPDQVDRVVIRVIQLEVLARPRGKARKVNVSRTGIVIVIQIFGVDVKKWRLDKAKQHCRQTEDGRGCAHR